jgi:uncharacterized protein
MKINNEFTVSVPVEQAWDIMLDLERVAPCLPGAAIQEDKGDGEYEGTMKVKLGPITANYKGTVKFEEVDEENHRAVLNASGRDARGQGTASATIVATLHEEEDHTKVNVETDMRLTGRAAQFGRGIAQDVATKMLDQFAECLEKEMSGGPAAEEAAAAATETSQEAGSQEAVSATPGATATGGRVEAGMVAESDVAGAPTAETEQQRAQEEPRREPEEPEAFDLGAASQEAILKRAVPVLAGLGLLVFLIWLIRRYSGTQ